ncbi:1-acyl-sn-glycerol-3-phosphate acyltransferase [candidate division KSB1 bacterium]|nr:1-acyl-sn-glycerol-3-phosphate acyltransferase [candidate division KSB1 bacterium]
MSTLHKDIFKSILKQIHEKYPEDSMHRDLIQDTFYWEQQRLNNAKKSDAQKKEKQFYQDLQKQYLNGKGKTTPVFRALLKRHLSEIQGDFSEAVFKFSNSILTLGIDFLMREFKFTTLFKSKSKHRPPIDSIKIRGEIDIVRKLSKTGTLICTPNHVSNLDSIILGFGLHISGLPPFTYGAGLNLFGNPILAFFMNNLGAYKVDRLKRHKLYKEILKMYSISILQNGQNSLFYPGGTRLRSGGLESELKLGLMGTGITAYFRNIQEGHPERKIYYIPAVLSYHIVLEAGSLIRDHLHSEGKQRFVLAGDAFHKKAKIRHFFQNLFRLDSSVYLHIGHPLDPFGNRVNELGESIDNQGRVIDTRRYFLSDDKIVADDNRDRVYTSMLGEKILREIYRCNTILVTHLVAFALHAMIRAANPGLSVYRLLGLPRANRQVARSDLLRYIDILAADLREKYRAGILQVEDEILNAPADIILNKALKILTRYHTILPLKVVDQSIQAKNMSVVIYYGNRLDQVPGLTMPAPPAALLSSIKPTYENPEVLN